MFEDSLIESTNRIKTRRGTATLVSFVIQAVIIAVLVLIPLLVTQAVPVAQLTTMLVAPPPPPPPPPPPSAAKAVQTKPVESNVVNNELQTPLKIPQKVEMIKEAQPPSTAAPSVAGVTGGVAGGTAGGQIGGVIGGVIGSVPVSVPKAATPERVRVSQGVSQGLLVNKVMPEYPALAKQARIQGQVVLQAVIGKDGKVENLQVVRGHPMLTAAALQAVKEWRYKPYMLNGQPTEVETLITVNFSLAGA